MIPYLTLRTNSLRLVPVVVAALCLPASRARGQDAADSATGQESGVHFHRSLPALNGEGGEGLAAPAAQPVFHSPAVGLNDADGVAQSGSPAASPDAQGPDHSAAVGSNGGDGTAQPAPGDNQIPFQGAPPGLNEATAQPTPVPTDITAVTEGQNEMANLGDQKETIGSELRYAQSKLDAARKRLDVEAFAGHTDQADKWQQEVHDWDARVRSLEAQQSQIDSEFQGAAQSEQPPSPEETMILPGDTVEIYVVEDASFNGRYQVRRGGYIIMPAVGRIALAGKNTPQAEQEVRKALETSQLQHATVMVEKVEGSDIESGPVIFLAGAFRNPRPFRIPPGTKPTVVNVILSCGGVTGNADLTRVKVMRIVQNKSLVEDVNIERIFEGGGLTSDLTLTDGDIILIPSGASTNIFVTGCVGRPGSQYLQTGLTAYTAILNAGGFSRFADLKRVYVLRASPDGTKVRIPVNVIAIQHGHIPDLPLVPSDILIVPEKFFSF